MLTGFIKSTEQKLFSFLQIIKPCFSLIGNTEETLKWLNQVQHHQDNSLNLKKVGFQASQQTTDELISDHNIIREKECRVMLIEELTQFSRSCHPKGAY